MIKIKLSPTGKKHTIKYRLVIMEKKSKLTGRTIDEIGYYIPATGQLQADRNKFKEWIAKGAKPTARVRKLLTI